MRFTGLDAVRAAVAAPRVKHHPSATSALDGFACYHWHRFTSIAMIKFILKSLRYRSPRSGTIRVVGTKTKTGNANSEIWFGGLKWSLTPAGPHRKRTRGDVRRLHLELIEAIQYGEVECYDEELWDQT